jgi:hypothetical protein
MNAYGFFFASSKTQISRSNAESEVRRSERRHDGVMGDGAAMATWVCWVSILMLCEIGKEPEVGDNQDKFLE